MKGHIYTFEGGQRIEGLHPDQVREAAAVLEHYQGSVTLEDALAHAIAHTWAWEEHRLRREQEHARLAARVHAHVRRTVPR